MMPLQRRQMFNQQNRDQVCVRERETEWERDLNIMQRCNKVNTEGKRKSVFGDEEETSKRMFILKLHASEDKLPRSHFKHKIIICKFM